jgi:capsular polysaccharide transport system permease protein
MTQAIPHRTSLEVTLSVWKALFLREAVTRLSAGRAAWAWLLLQPLVHVGLIMLFYSTIRKKTIPGADAGIFIAIGVLGFFMFRKAADRSSGAISANKALFAYRQVHPVDAVLVRCMLEGALQAFVACILLVVAVAVGLDALPHNPLAALFAFFLLWLLGTGLGLILSAGGAMIPEIDRIAKIISMPMYLMSGVLYSIHILPPMLRDILLINPIVHGLEYMRAAFFKGYYLLPSIDIFYLAEWALLTLFLGLALHVRFARRLAVI